MTNVFAFNKIICANNNWSYAEFVKLMLAAQAMDKLPALIHTDPGDENKEE